MVHNPVGAEMAPQIDQAAVNWHPNLRKTIHFWRSCFSRKHSNCCAGGTSWLSKGHFFDGDWLIFCFCFVSLYSVLYNMFITSFHKISVNVKPLSPLIFEEVAAY